MIHSSGAGDCEACWRCLPCRRRILTLETTPIFWINRFTRPKRGLRTRGQFCKVADSEPVAAARGCMPAACATPANCGKRVMVCATWRVTAPTSAAAASPRLRFLPIAARPNSSVAASPGCSVHFTTRRRCSCARAASRRYMLATTTRRAWRESNEASRRCYHVAEPPSATTSLDRLRTLEEGVLAAAVATPIRPRRTSRRSSCVQRLEFLYLAHRQSPSRADVRRRRQRSRVADPVENFV